MVDGIGCFDQTADVGVGPLDSDGVTGGVDLESKIADALCI